MMIALLVQQFFREIPTFTSSEVRFYNGEAEAALLWAERRMADCLDYRMSYDAGSLCHLAIDLSMFRS